MPHPEGLPVSERPKPRLAMVPGQSAHHCYLFSITCLRSPDVQGAALRPVSLCPDLAATSYQRRRRQRPRIRVVPRLGTAMADQVGAGLTLTENLLAVIEGGTHANAGGPAVLRMLEWFASFETSVP